MNKQFKVIFNRTLGQFVVVSELAKSCDKSSGSSSVCSKSAVGFSSVLARLKPLCFSLFCALGFVSFSSFFSSAFADTFIIQADKSAPKNQQPIVLSTANGLPQVNIQTPNAKGLSHNKYSQFNVAEKGAILNNSRTGTSTQLAGQVTANPYLARGEAKVILNEVTSASPSVMKGYVEVAGGKADVIIANPSGLHCEGCGVINSGRVTLSTGKPEIKNGEVENFKVAGGKVVVSGRGLDNSRVDYTEILAREAEINAGIWSGKKATVITGKNTIKRTETNNTSEDNHLQIIHTNQPASSETQPQFALDVAELGGMYSGKIHLIGTEKGVGVRNAGHIVASSSDVEIDSAGRVVNTASGQIVAKAQNRLKTDRTLTNAGKLYAESKVEVKAKENVEQTSSGVIRGKQNRIESDKSLINRGAVLGTDKVVIKAAESVENIGTGSILGDKVAVQAGSQLINRDELVTEHGGENVKSAVIAVHSRLDLAAPDIINQKQFLTAVEKQAGVASEGVSLLSQGDLFAGRHLNEHDEVSVSSSSADLADSLKNQSGLIDVAGNAYFGVKSLINSNEHLKTAFELQSDTPLNEHHLLPEGQPNSAKISFETLRWIPFSRAGKVASKTVEMKEREPNGNLNGYVLPMPNEESCHNLAGAENCQIKPHALYLPNDGVWSYFNIHLDDKVHLAEKDYPDVNLLQAYFDIPDEPEQPIKVADESEAEFTKRLQAYEAEKAAYEANKSEYQAKQTALSAQLKPYLDWLKANEAQFEQLEKAIEKHNAAFTKKIHDRFWDINLNRRKISQTVVKQTAPGKILSGGDMLFQGGVHNDRSFVLAGGDLVSLDTNNPFKNTDEEGIHSTEEFGNHEFTWSRWRGGFKRYHQREWGGRHHRYTKDDVTIPLNVVFSQTQGDYAAATRQQGNSQTTAPFIKTADGKGEIRFTQGTTTLPSASLYQINPKADSHVLVETAPAFTDYRKWLSSDYMFNALRYEPNQVQKRLGDGYYEQRLVREQLYQLTGKLPSGQQQDFEAQYQALMDAAVKFSQTMANEFHLRPGVKLSKAQIARLTSDIVWLESETVTLPDGSQQEVLVPKVYLVANKADFSPLTTKGSLISAHNIYAKNSELINQGTIFGREVLQLRGDSLHNQGTLSAQRLYAQTSGDLTNEGGRIEAQNRLALNVGGTLTHRSTTSTDESGNPSGGHHYKNTHLDRKALLHVQGSDGTLYINADNLHQIGSDIINQGTGETVFNIKTNLKSTALSTQRSEKLGTGDHRRQETNQDLIISRIQSNGNIRLETDNLYTQGTAIETEKKLTALAENEMVLGTATTRTSLSENHLYKSGSAIAKTTKTTELMRQSENAVGTQLSANDIQLISQGDIQALGLEAVADKDIELIADGNLSISAATNRFKEQYKETKKTRGVFSGGGLGITIGSASGQHQYHTEGWTQSDARAAIGSLSGNVKIQSGNHTHITGTDLIAAKDKEIVLEGRAIEIEAGKDRIVKTEFHEQKQSGLSISLSSPITDLALSVQQSVERSGQVKNKRLKNLYLLKAAYDATAFQTAAKNTIDSITKLGSTEGMKEGDITTPNLKLSVSIGSSKSSSSAYSEEITHQASDIQGGHIRMRTTEGDIAVLGSHIQGRDLFFDSAKDFRVESLQDRFIQRSENKNSGWQLGGFIGGSGNSYGIGIEGSANYGKGKENTDTVTQYNSLIWGNNVKTQSQGDTTLAGANLKADKLEANIGGDLTIESRQDSNRYNSQQNQVGGGFSVAVYGSGSNASIQGSHSKAKMNYAQVETQSGIEVGKGGMAVNVAGNTHLEGGKIDSRAEVENNHFNTNRLTAQSIENHSEFEVKSHSSGFSTDMAANAINAMMTVSSLLGNQSESDQSLTQSAVADNINLNIKTGEIPTALSRDTENANQKVKQFDIQAIKQEVAENQEMAKVAGEIAAKAAGDIAQRLNWKDGSVEKIALHAVAGYLAGKAAGTNATVAAAAGAASEWLNTEVAAYLDKNYPNLNQEQKNALQQASAMVLGAAIGATVGGSKADIAQGALSAFSAEKFNRQLHPDAIKLIRENWEAFAKANNLSQEEAQQILMEEAMRGVSDDAAHLNLNQTARDYLNKLQQEANNLNLFAILDRSSDEYKNSVIYSGEIASNQDLYNLVRKPSNYYAQSTSDLLMLSALRENTAYFEQAKKAEALKLYQGGLSQIDAYEKFAAIYAESYAEKGDKELLKSAQAYRARANALKNTMQSQYPNASGLFSFSELWNAANPMGQVVANSLIESGSDAAWGQLFKVNRLQMLASSEKGNVEALGKNNPKYNRELNEKITNKPESIRNQKVNDRVSEIAYQFNTKSIEPKDMKLNINGKTYTTNPDTSTGVPVFQGVSDRDVIAYFKELAGVDKLPNPKPISKMRDLEGNIGKVWGVKPIDGPLKGSTVNLRNFSSSQHQTNAKFTIEIVKPDQGISGLKNSIEIKFER